jgi:integrase
MAGELVDLAAFFVEPHPAAALLNVVVLDLHIDDRADAGEGVPPVSGRQLALVGASASDQLPAIFLRSESAGKRFWEFFTANIRNRNTRRAYFVAVTQFSKWCDQKKLRLEDIEPIHVAGYIEQLGTVLAKPSVKQHLAAIRMLFDWLVTGQVMPTNPAHAVRGPKHSVKKGKTSVLAAEEMRTLLDSIDAGTLIGLRDRALIALMGYFIIYSRAIH